MEEALRDKAAIIQHLQTHADKLKAESPEDIQSQIDESVEKIRSDWKSVEERLNRVQSAYHRATDSWNLVLRLKSDISEWLRPIYPVVVELESKTGGESGGEKRVELVSRLQNELPVYEKKMNELDQAAKELYMTLFYQRANGGDHGGGGVGVAEQMISTAAATGDKILGIGDASENGSGGGPILQVQAIANGKQQQLPITIELEALNRKLLFLRNFLSFVADNQQGGDGKPNELFEQARATFSSVSAVSAIPVLRIMTCLKWQNIYLACLHFAVFRASSQRKNRQLTGFP